MCLTAAIKSCTMCYGLTSYCLMFYCHIFNSFIYYIFSLYCCFLYCAWVFAAVTCVFYCHRLVLGTHFRDLIVSVSVILKLYGM